MKQKATSARATDALKDEVYRQMLRLEARRPAAQLLLAVALLNAWMALERQRPDSEPRQWLRSVCPVCLRMIHTERASEDQGRLACPTNAG